MQWEAVMGNNPSYFKGANRPVERVSWDDVQTFIQRLNQREGGDSRPVGRSIFATTTRAFV